jgi:hypothetical protein
VVSQPRTRRSGSNGPAGDPPGACGRPLRVAGRKNLARNLQVCVANLVADG